MKNNWKVAGTGSEHQVREAAMVLTPTNVLSLTGPGSSGVGEEQQELISGCGRLAFKSVSDIC